MKNRNWAILLASSVALNMFMAGFITSRLGGPPRHGGPEQGFIEALETLSPPQQEAIGKLVEAHEHKVHAEMEGMHRLFDQIKPLLTAPHFDEKSFAALEKKIETKDRDVKGRMGMMVREIATTLPDDDRIRYFSHVFEDHRFPGPPPGRP